MKDQLKEFIDRNRDEFDDKNPPQGAWKKINRSLNPSTGLWSSVSVWRAAAAVFFALSVYLLFIGVRPAPKADVSHLQGEFSDLEVFYGSQIAEKVALIDDFDNAYEDDQFTQDFQKLDAMYQVLREEMKSKPSPKVKDALILNMLIRIDLLNQEIKKLEDHRKKTDATPAEI